MYTQPGTTVSLRPFYLPEEFHAAVFTLLSANIKAAELTAGDANDMLDKYLGAPLFILGYLDNRKLNCVLPSFQQYVDIPTRLESILDLCYGNIPNTSHARLYSPLGADDHNIISLLLYRQLKHCPQYCITPQWSIACCHGFLATTDWDIFNGNVCYTSLIKLLLLQTYSLPNYFYISTCIPVKTIRKFPNPKPWITPQIKHCLTEKHKAFKEKNRINLKTANRIIKNEIHREKLKFNDKLEYEFLYMHAKQAFQKLRTLTGCEPKASTCAITDQQYLSGNSMHFSHVLTSFMNRRPSLWKMWGANWARSPVPMARMLKNCTQELSPIVHSLFSEVYFTATSPPPGKRLP